MAASKPPTRFFQTCLGVFQGGGCRGAAFVGALNEAFERKVDFAGVAGTSAGSIIAALLGAGAKGERLEKIVKSLNFLDLLKPPEVVSSNPSGWKAKLGLWLAGGFLPEPTKIWEYHGIYSSRGIEDWLNEQLKALLPEVKGPVTFKDLPVPTWVVATDIVANDVKVWSSLTNQDDEVAFAVRCSCSIPGFFQPVNSRYIDGGVLSNLPAFVFSGPEFAQNKPLANRILSFTLLASREDKAPQSTKELLLATVNTVVDGASRLQGRLIHPIHEIAISTGEIQATDFDKMDDPRVLWLISEGRKAAEKFFDDELGRVQTVTKRTNLLPGDDEIYSALTETLDEPHTDQVVISDKETNWVYALFPTLLAWRFRKARIQVILSSKEAASEHERYRRRLLRALGAELSVTSPLPFSGFVLNPQDQALAKAIVIAPEEVGAKHLAVRYQAPHDFPVIRALWQSLNVGMDPNILNVKPEICSVSENQILSCLRRHVQAYATGGTVLAMETIRVDSLISLTRLVRGYKYKQISQLFELFQKASLLRFEAAEVRYTDQLSTLVTPPVVEYSGGRYMLIQGNTRALYCYKNGIDELRCVVVRNHTTPLPSDQRLPLKDVLIGGRTVSTTDRYGRDIDKDYRQIEWATHHPEETLLDAKVF